MLMWATKAEDLNLGGYVTEWDSELRHAAVRGRGGQISKVRLLPPSASCTPAGHHVPTGPVVHCFMYAPAAGNRPGGSVHRERPSEPSGARESGKLGLVGGRRTRAQATAMCPTIGDAVLWGPHRN